MAVRDNLTINRTAELDPVQHTSHFHRFQLSSIHHWQFLCISRPIINVHSPHHKLHSLGNESNSRFVSHLLSTRLLFFLRGTLTEMATNKSGPKYYVVWHIA